MTVKIIQGGKLVVPRTKLLGDIGEPRCDEHWPKPSLRIYDLGAKHRRRMWWSRFWFAMAIACLVVVVVKLTGCRTYKYKSPEGSELSIQVPALSNTNLGSVKAWRKMADGSEVGIEVENYTVEEHLTQAISVLAGAAARGALP